MTAPDPTKETIGDGQSQGGAYPNPHSGTSPETPDGKKAVEGDTGGDNGGGHAAGTGPKD